MESTNIKIFTCKCITVLSVFLLLIFSTPVFSGQYDLRWHTIDGGGGTSSSGSYTLSGTIGQPDAGVVMSGGDFTLSGGFWPGDFGCIVNFYDLAIFCEQWLEIGPNWIADLDGQGKVDFIDYNILAGYWFDNCPPDWPLK